MKDTFIVTIEGREAHTWQGTILHRGKTYPFISELELLFSIQHLLEMDAPQTQSDQERESIL